MRAILTCGMVPLLLLVDGSVHFVSEDIDADLLCRLCTRSGGEVVHADF